ncbi:MAG: N-acetylmuramoyl-L-alanine amidase family protein [Lachnospiraceae bacterium]|nr:N-acetylmuramoyl-L-alanine amidase family protein [Lachnospiraceae bacterium]
MELRHGVEQNIRRRIRQMLVGAAAALACSAMAMTAYGASTIGSLSITVDGENQEGTLTEPSVAVSPSSCELSDISWSKEVEDWKPGKMVYGYLTITADDGREFESSYSGSKCSVKGADFRSASADEGDPATLEVTIKYTPKITLGMPEEAGWSDSTKTRASWKKVPYATAYDFRLYQDGTLVKTLEVTGTSVDVSSYIKGEGDYDYEVRAKGKTASERKYLLTGQYMASGDTLTMDTEELGDIGGRWSNYQEGRKYRTGDGVYPASQWMMIMGEWYYFNLDGFAATGWHHDEASGLWYYLNEQGVMQTGWVQVNQVWYYLNEQGVMQTGWIQTNPGEWYYMNPDGSMAVNTVIDGKYTIDSNGRYTAAPGSSF